MMHTLFFMFLFAARLDFPNDQLPQEPLVGASFSLTPNHDILVKGHGIKDRDRFWLFGLDGSLQHYADLNDQLALATLPYAEMTRLQSDPTPFRIAHIVPYREHFLVFAWRSKPDAKPLPQEQRLFVFDQQLKLLGVGGRMIDDQVNYELSADNHAVLPDGRLFLQHVERRIDPFPRRECTISYWYQVKFEPAEQGFFQLPSLSGPFFMDEAAAASLPSFFDNGWLVTKPKSNRLLGVHELEPELHVGVQNPTGQFGRNGIIPLTLPGFRHYLQASHMASSPEEIFDRFSRIVTFRTLANDNLQIAYTHFPDACNAAVQMAIQELKADGSAVGEPKLVDVEAIHWNAYVVGAIEDRWLVVERTGPKRLTYHLKTITP